MDRTTIDLRLDVDRASLLQSLIDDLRGARGAVLLVGAGISWAAPASLPLAEDIRRPILEALWECTEVAAPGSIPDADRTSIAARVRVVALEKLLGSVDHVFSLARPQDDSIREITANWLRTRPNLCHEAIGRLAAAGQVRALISLNFDTLTESQLDPSWRVRTPEDFARTEPLERIVYKPHGTLRRTSDGRVDTTSLRFTLRALERRSDLSIQRAVASIVEDGVLVVLGYSDRDIDITPALKGARPRSVHWLLYAPAGADVPHADVNMVRDIAGKTRHTIYAADAETFLRAVLQLLHIPPPAASLEARSPEPMDGFLAHVRRDPVVATVALADLLEGCGEWRAGVATLNGLLASVPRERLSEPVLLYGLLRRAQGHRARGEIEGANRDFAEVARVGRKDLRGRVLALEATAELVHGHWQILKRHGSISAAVAGAWAACRLLAFAAVSRRVNKDPETLKTLESLRRRTIHYCGDLLHWAAHAAILQGYPEGRRFALRVAEVLYSRTVEEPFEYENQYWVARLREVRAELGAPMELGPHEEFFLEALRRAEVTNDRLGQGNAHAAIGLVASLRDAPSEAMAHFERAVSCYVGDGSDTHFSGLHLVACLKLRAGLATRDEAVRAARDARANRYSEQP